MASRSEKKVNAALQLAGLESYLPVKTETRQWSDRKKTVVTPLINGYVFVKTGEHNRDLVFKVPSVLQYVRFNGKDAIVRDEEIEVMKVVEAKGYHVEGKFGVNYNIGDEVIISEGPFKGYKGVIVNNKHKTLLKMAINSIDFQLTISLTDELISK